MSNKAFPKWILSTIRDREKILLPLNKDHDGTFIIPLAYAVTVKYQNVNSFSGKPTPGYFDKINKIFQSVYSVAAQYGGHKYWRRNPWSCPTCFAFCDVSGSKYGQKNAIHANDDPHHHATFVLHPNQAKYWKENGVGLLAERIEKFTEVQSTEIEPLKHEDDVVRWVHYSSKYHISVSSDVRISDVTFALI